MVDVGRAWGKYFKLFSNKYGKIIFRSLCIGMKREKYLINRYNEFKAIRAKERKNPSPDHEGKMLVIENELNRLSKGRDKHRIVLLCAEKEPLDCHRTILVSRYLYKMGISVKHILANGELEDHYDTEQRMVRSLGIGNELFDYSSTLTERIEKAYHDQTRKIAYRIDNKEETI